jgi:nicotinate-nucleotide--dimethylbenzimidazole phosphoribosyltransferase
MFCNWQSAINNIDGINQQIQKNAAKRIDNLAMPLRALGRIHTLGEQLAGITESPNPIINNCAVVVFCGDHGIAIHGVSAYPQEVTRSNMRQMVMGKATISAFCKTLGARLFVVDVGVKGPRLTVKNNCGNYIEFDDLRIAEWTNDFHKTKAMSIQQTEQAIEVGYNKVLNVCDKADVIVLGEMGIGNTSSASALTAILLDIEIGSITGPGTGLYGSALNNKKRILRESLNRIEWEILTQANPINVLSEYGGYEIAAMVGGYIAAAKKKTPVLLDGFISSVAALISVKLCPKVDFVQIATTLSSEPGHEKVLSALQKRELFSLDMRLGEGSAAIMAFPFLKLAASQFSQIGTMDDVLNFSDDSI